MGIVTALGPHWAAHAADCSSPLMNTNDHAHCEERNEAAARWRMASALKQALGAATVVDQRDGTGFAVRLRVNQMLWTQWADSQCALERDTFLGSAVAFESPLCRRKLDDARAAWLSHLAEQLKAW